MTEERKDRLPDEEFEAYLEGRSKISHGYRRLREIEPPSELDRAVLREARSAVTPSARRRPFLSAWLPRLAVAATLLVAVGVALQFDSAPIDTLPLEQTVMRDAPAVRAVPREAPPDVLLEPRLEVPVTPSRMEPLEIVRSEAEPEDAVASGGPDERADAALRVRENLAQKDAIEPDDGASSTISTMPRPEIVRSEAEAEDAAASGGFDEQAAAAMPEGQGSARESAAEPDAGVRGQETARGGESFESESRRLADADQPLQFYVDAPRAYARRDLAPDRPRVDGLGAALRSRLGGGRDLSDEAVLADVDRRLLRVNAHFYRRSGEALTMFSSETAPSEPLPREDWLALIDALIDVGDTDAAQSEVVRFVEAWPDYLLAPRHQALLSEE